jgi:hypothetical protein
MDVEEIAKLIKAQPFVPFRICLTDGSGYDVMHPDFVLLAKSVIDVGIPSAKASPIADSIVRISPLHIVKIETLQAA